MKKFFSNLLDKFSSNDEKEEMMEKDDFEQDYVELDDVKGTKSSSGSSKSKIVVRPYRIEDFSDVKGILDALREGYTIALINISSLKEKDIVELKRAISKLKKTCDAIEGDIAGFDEDYLVVTPSFAKIYRSGADSGQKEIKVEPEYDDY